MNDTVGVGQSLPVKGSRFRLVASFFLAAVPVGAFLYLLISLRTGAEAAVAGVAGLLPLGYAFAAGMVASVNPCGFFMLPSYISYQLGTEEEGFYDRPSGARVARALLLGGIATAAFILIFAVVGTIVAAGGYWVARIFPYAGLAMGAAMVGLGIWLLVTHGTLGIMAASRVAVTPRRELRNVFFFGIAYAVGSLSCTLPIFLVVVGSALATRGFLSSFGQFIGYALGMGLVLVIATVGAATFRGFLTRWLRPLIPHVHRVSALFLLGAGAYLVYYWLFYAKFFF